MSNYFEKIYVVLRVALGWVMLYAGLTKVFDPMWSAAGYLMNATTFPSFFAWFAQPNILPFTNFANEWGLTLLGLSLILGIWVRWSAVPGFFLMLLYYFSVLEFPFVGHSFLIDDHIIYALVLLMFAAYPAEKIWNVRGWLKSQY